MIKQIWQPLSIKIKNEHHAIQVQRILERSKKVRSIELRNGAVHYEQKTWSEE